MIRNALFASAIILGTASAALAQAPRDGSAAALDGNIVGGGYASLSGGGDNATVAYSTSGAGGMTFHAQPGRAARFAATQGDGPAVEYTAPADTNPGREALLLGGGDNAEVVYGRRR